MNMKMTMAIVAAFSGLSGAQIYQPAVRGNAIDASRQLGAGGINAPVRTYGNIGYSGGGFGNLYITGNVSAGRQFRGFVPYSDPTQFQARLGSSALNTFESDAPSLNRIERGYGLGQVEPYYNRNSTILPLSAQRYGLTIPGSSMPRTSILPQPESFGTWALRRPPGPIAGALPERVRPGDILVPMTGAPEAAMRPAETVSPFEPSQDLTPTQKEFLQRALEKEETPAVTPEPRIQPAPEEQIPTGTETEAQTEDFSSWLRRQAETAERPAIRVGPQPEYAESARRMALESRDQPASQPATRPRSDAGRRTGEKKPAPVISDLTGRGTDEFSRTMRSAQRWMNQGRFYDAFQQYSQALTIKPDDPVPVFGQANALLAAGELRLAAEHLQEALKRFPTFVRLTLDGARLLGSRNILDRRRQQLTTLSKKNGDPQIELLLGYSELLSGDRRAGLNRMAASGLAVIQ